MRQHADWNEWRRRWETWNRRLSSSKPPPAFPKAACCRRCWRSGCCAFHNLPKGYYGIESIFLLVAMMALARLTAIEQLRYIAPGEWGNLLGLDRVPEVRCPRNKLEVLCGREGQADKWNTELAKDWMGELPAGEIFEILLPGRVEKEFPCPRSKSRVAQGWSYSCPLPWKRTFAVRGVSSVSLRLRDTLARYRGEGPSRSAE